MDHKLPTDNGPEEIRMKQMAAFGLVFAVIGTVISAMQHLRGWTVFGLLLVALDIALLTMAGE